MSESDIEKACVKRANELGYMNRKLDIGPGGKGWLDQLFFGPNGSAFIVEFKMPGEKVSPKQHIRITRLQRMHHRVYVCESYPGFEQILEYEARLTPTLVEL